MKKAFLLTLGLLLIGSVSARSIGQVQIAPKTERGIVTFSEFNMLSDAISALTDVFNGTIGDVAEIIFPKAVRVTQLCIVEDCRTSWPIPILPPWSTTGSDINRMGGNVGIGITTPSSKLRVEGNLDVSGNITKNSAPIIPTCTDGQRIIYQGGELACGIQKNLYAWISSPFGTCDCSGNRTRSVICQKNGTEAMPDAYCPSEDKPEETETCSPPPSC